MSRVMMLVINPMVSDSRVEKEASSLAAAGHDVIVVATAAAGQPAQETRDGFTIVRVPYRRVIKDRLTGPSRRVRIEAAERRRVADALEVTGDAGGPTLDRAAWLVRRMWARVIWYAGGAVLKLLRSRILIPEYWGGIASRLPQRLPRPDVIHAHDLGPLKAAVRLARIWGREGSRPKVVYDSHELYVEQQTSWRPRERRMWRLHERRWIRQADLVITVSPGISSELSRRYRLSQPPTVVMNSPSSQETQSASDVRTDVGVSAGTPLLVYVGTVKPGRGVERLVPALVQRDWHLAIVGAGDGEHADLIIGRARQSGLEGRVHLLPAVPAATLPDYIRTADVGVHPMERSCLNHDLALPNKLFDYLFAGLPVAVSDLREMGTLVRSRELGTSFDPEDPRSVVRAIEGAMAIGPRPVLSDELRTELSWEAQARRLLDAYERL